MKKFLSIAVLFAVISASSFASPHDSPPTQSDDGYSLNIEKDAFVNGTVFQVTAMADLAYEMNVVVDQPVIAVATDITTVKNATVKNEVTAVLPEVNVPPSGSYQRPDACQLYSRNKQNTTDKHTWRQNAPPNSQGC